MEGSSGVKIEPFDDKKKYTRSKLASDEGGINIADEEGTIGIMLEVVKKYGPQLKDGTFEIATLPKPSKVCSPVTLLETVSNDMVQCTPYLNLAAKQTDPMKRMKYIAAYMVGSYHRNITMHQKSNSDPTLGENYCCQKPDGTMFYAEYICTKPKTVIYSIYGPDGLWKAHGWGKIEVQLGVNSMDAIRNGKTTIYFKDGSEIQITNPGIKVDGLLVGKRMLNLTKKPFFVDKKNSLMGEIYFNFENYVDVLKDVGKKNKKYWFEDPSKKPTDYLGVLISKYTKDPKTNEIKKDYQSFGSGSWLEYFQADNEVFWRIDDEVDAWVQPPEELQLPSHSRKRPDYPFQVAKEYEKADVEKDKLEMQQAMDDKLRAAKGKK